MKTNTDKTSDRQLGSVQFSCGKAHALKLGIDVHADRYVVVRQIDGNTPQPAQTFPPAAFLAWVQTQFALAARVHTCYEAGPFGYGLHRTLTALGATNYVIRTCVVLVFAWCLAIPALRESSLAAVSRKTWVFLALSGLATGLSWVCYFRALQLGKASQVAPVDKLSVAIAIVLAIVFLGERLNLRESIGAGLVVVGAPVMALK